MRYTWLLVSVSSALLATGCNGGGGSGLFSALSDFFGGSSNSSSSTLDLLSSLPGGSGGTGGGSSLDDFSDSDGVPDVATIHNPEPASMTLFGAGLAGAAFIRRRRSRRRTT